MIIDYKEFINETYRKIYGDMKMEKSEVSRKLKHLSLLEMWFHTEYGGEQEKLFQTRRIRPVWIYLEIEGIERGD